MYLKQQLLIFRRRVLGLIPEFIWPQFVNLDGVKIPIRGKSWSFGTKYLISKGNYELEERQLLKNILKPGMQVLELGGSIGILTAIIAEGIGVNGRLVSVEASARLVKESITWLPLKYKWLSIVQGFAFPVWQLPEVKINSFNEIKGSLGGTLSFEVKNPKDLKQLKYAQDTSLFDINTLCYTFNIKPSLLVIDIEGSETIINNVDFQLPSFVKIILIELHPGLYENKFQDLELIIRAIKKDGFMISAECNGVYLFERP